MSPASKRASGSRGRAYSTIAALASSPVTTAPCLAASVAGRPAPQPASRSRVPFSIRNAPSTSATSCAVRRSSPSAQSRGLAPHSIACTFAEPPSLSMCASIANKVAAAPRAENPRWAKWIVSSRETIHGCRMDRVQSMEVFARVAQHMGFARAARHLRMSTASVSKHVTALEARVGTRLFDRTTRRVALTEAGRAYLERCQECLQALDDADASVGDLAGEPRGLLRLTAPIDFGETLHPVMIEVMRMHPELGIDLRLSNRVVDMVEEGFD